MDTKPKLVHIYRSAYTMQGTPGLLVTDGFHCRTIELPWKDNARKISCIPAGVYSARMRVSPRFGRVYEILNVPGRSNILIHAANYAGSKPEYKSDVEGCIGLGKYIGLLAGQTAVLVSRPTVTDFMEHMQYKPFTLIIKEASEGEA